MTELDLIYETSQHTDIVPSALIEKIILYLNSEYKIKYITDCKIEIEHDFKRDSGSLNWNWKRFTTILHGKFEISDSKIILTYEIDILGPLLPLIIGILISLANPWGLMLPIPFTVQQLFQILVLKNESQRILREITVNTDQPLTTKFKSIRID